MAVEFNCSEGNQPGQIYFNTVSAVRRLVAGEPVQFVFGREFGWPLPPLLKIELRRSYLEGKGFTYEKAVANTLLTALAGDTASALMTEPYPQTSGVKPFSLQDPISNQTIETILQPLFIDTIRLTETIINRESLPDSMLIKTVQACKILLAMEITDAVDETKSKTIVQLFATGKDLMMPSLNLIPKTKPPDTNYQSTSGTLCEDLINSYGMFGRPAAGDFIYMAIYMAAALSNPKRPRYRSSLHSQIEKPKGKPRVVLVREYLEKVNSYYSNVGLRSHRLPLVATGCPANGFLGEMPVNQSETKPISLIGALLIRFANTVHHFAETDPANSYPIPTLPR